MGAITVHFRRYRPLDGRPGWLMAEFIGKRWLQEFESCRLYSYSFDPVEFIVFPRVRMKSTNQGVIGIYAHQCDPPAKRSNTIR